MIGSKKKTKNSEKINVSGAVKGVKKLAKTKPRKYKSQKVTGLKPAKRFNQFLKNYDILRRQGEIDEIKEIEEIRKLLNKDGTPNKRALRSKKAQKDYNDRIKAFNKTHKKWGKQAVKEIAEKQQDIKQQRADTYKQRKVKEALEETSGAANLEQVAQNALSKYQKMVDLFALDSFEKLRHELNLGSKTPEIMSGGDYSKQDADNYFKDFLDAYNNIPTEARKYLSSDDLNAALVSMIEIVGTENVSETITEYLQAGDSEEKDRIIKLSLFHSQNADKTNKSFSEFYNDLIGGNYTDLDNEKTWSELL